MLRLMVLVVPLAGGFSSARATTVVSGHVTHPQGKTVAISYGLEPLSWRPLHRVVARLDAKGDFTVTLPGLTAPTEGEFAHGEETSRLFLTPGDHLRLTIDPTKFDETIRFTGTGANANNFLAQSYLRFDDDDKYLASPLSAVTMTTAMPAQMQARIAAFQKKRLAFLKTYAATHPLPAVFRAYARQHAAFEAADNLLTYPIIREFMKQQTPKGEAVPANLSAALPANYYAPLAALRPAQDSALAMSNGKLIAFLDSYAANKFEPNDSIPTGHELYARATRQFGEGPVRDLAVAKYLTNLLAEHDASQATPLLAAFRQLNRDSAYARAIRDTYQKNLKVSAGAPAPAFVAQDAAGKPVTLADFRGKVVYVDFWASWCGPCLAEMPASTVLKKQFEGKDVVFLYLSVDADVAAWKKALAKHPLASPNSVHARVPGHDFDGPVQAAYLINAIPRYYLIGRDGRILDGHAGRPSAGEATVAALNAALAK
ncbi:TlpA family protein disulfide reductase [Hymenobacter sp. BT662]|uniref:TlpA family protein disulfide reductase n=1 Tax=Hymenobacter ruricola TaxID=2791023 RepID=A0ABS0I2B6_9BACT|nr:TlpA family protein disulfide reductase [Hymenobacter ruricola]